MGYSFGEEQALMSDDSCADMALTVVWFVLLVSQFVSVTHDGLSLRP